MFTLHVEHAVLLGLFTVLTLINCLLHNGARGAYWFPAFNLSAFVGAVLIALRGHGVSDVVSIVFGMIFFHLAYLFLHCGLDGFFDTGREQRWPLYTQLVLVLGGIACLIEFGAVHPDTGNRLIAYSVIFAAQTALTAAVVQRNAAGTLAIPGKLMSVLLALLSVNNLVRALLTLHGGAPANYMNGGLGLQLALLETTVLQGGITVAFVWMTAAVLHGKLALLAATDPLTGLLNRRGLELSVEREIALSRKNRSPLTAILIDLDRFKQINDTYGHPFGDRVLLEVARCLQRHMRKSDILARVGGDEFALLLNDTGRERALEIAERLRGSLEALVVREGETAARVSASFGLTQVDSTASDWNDLFVRCDKGVYAVKELGGNLAVAG